MASPTITLTTNKTSYAPGEQIIVTAAYGDTDSKDLVITGVATDAGGNQTPATVTVKIDVVTVAVTSSPTRTWTKTDTGGQAVFTTTA